MRPVQASGDDLVGLERQPACQGQGPDPRDVLRRRQGEEVAHPLGDERVDPMVSQRLDPALDPAGLFPRQGGRGLERVDQGIAAHLAGQRRVDPAVDAVHGAAPLAADFEVRHQAAEQPLGGDQHRVLERGPAVAAGRQLDDADEPAERAPRELADDAHPLAFDPLEGMLAPAHLQAGRLELAEPLHPAGRVGLVAERDGRQAQGAVQPLGVRDRGPELPGRWTRAPSGT